MSVSSEMRERFASMYADGQSLSQISAKTGVNRSRVRRELLKAGVEMRGRVEALRIREGLASHFRGKRRTFSPEHCQNISASRQAWAERNARGYTVKATGYVEITTGEYKGRSEHVRVMEERLGRRLMPDEVVHHIDRNRSNNDINNLALLTRSGHSRLHRFEDRLEGKERKKANGRFS